MHIKAFCSVTGLTRDTVNFYVERGLLAPSRCANGYRDFDQTQVEAAQMIRFAKALGFTLSEIAKLADQYASGANNLQKSSILREQLDRLAVRKQALANLEAGLYAKIALLEKGVL